MLNVDGPKTSGSGQDGFDVKVAGDARVRLIGFPSVAKSSLLAKPNVKTFEVFGKDIGGIGCLTLIGFCCKDNSSSHFEHHTLYYK